jgi:6-phosphogluconolactonase (cycloisomerase 2 family)
MRIRLGRATAIVAVVSSVLYLSACAGNSPAPTAPQVIEQSASASRVQHTGAAPSRRSKNARIYVANVDPHNAYTGSVRVFPWDANGNVEPKLLISGNGLQNPVGVALDPDRNVYVTNEQSLLSYQYFAVTVYAAGAPGNAPPIQTITGSKTGLSGCVGIAVDANGNIYVANNSGSVTVYAAGANGNVAPIRTISGGSTGMDEPTGIALDASNNIFVANNGDNSVTVYAKGANGNVAPIRTIRGGRTGMEGAFGLALDASRNIYIANYGNNSVTVYAKGANGNVAPIRTISGGSTLLSYPYGISLDASNNIYVANAYVCLCISVYAAGANGNVAPIRIISGKKTKLSRPFGIAVR